MSTVKSSSEDLTLNADGSGNNVVIQKKKTKVYTEMSEKQSNLTKELRYA
jgi:hypothetical protein